MGRQIPRNVKQIGNVSDEPKIYVEDYVDTYLNQLRKAVTVEPVVALLTGEILETGESRCVFVTGAVRKVKYEYQTEEEYLSKDEYEETKKVCQQYFPQSEIVGWYIAIQSEPFETDGTILKLHEKYFQDTGSLLIMKTAEYEEEAFYAYKFHDLLQIGGYYVFYEKNPQMQEYMINSRKHANSEVVDDLATKSFRDTMRDKTKEKSHTHSRFLRPVASVMAAVLALFIGVLPFYRYGSPYVMESLSRFFFEEEEASEMEMSQLQVEKQEEQIPVSETTEESAVTEEENLTTSEEETQIEETTEEETEAVQTTAPVTTDYTYYVVKEGDTLDRISLHVYGTINEVDAICRMNGLKDGNLIYIGQRLLLP